LIDKPGKYRTYNYPENITSPGTIKANECYRMKFYNIGTGGSFPVLTFANGSKITLNATSLIGSGTPFELIADPQYPIVDTIEVSFLGAGVNDLLILRTFALPIDPDSAEKTKTF